VDALDEIGISSSKTLLGS